MPAAILIVEDDRDLATAMGLALTREGFEVDLVGTGAEALARARAEPPPDLVLLDLMLPDTSGLEVCKALRADPATRMLPVVIVSARAEEIDRVVGFEIGADDYIPKPFSLRELGLRVRAILRRVAPVAPRNDRLVCGKVCIDTAAYRAWVDGQEIVLTALELRLLFVLASHPGKVHSRESLLADVWGVTAEVTTRTVDTHILRLREKLGPAADQLQTLRGVGYRFSADPTPDPG